MAQKLTADQIQDTFDQLIAPRTKEDMTLLPVELNHFTNCDYATFVTAVKSTARWLEKKNALGHTPTHNGIAKSVAESIKYNQSKQAGTQYANTPAPAPVVTEESRAEKVRGLFQSLCTSGDWTITTQEAEELLRVHSMKALKNVFNTLGRTFTEDEAAQAFDAIAWHAELSTLVSQ
jgi:hypothetical protein